MTRSVLVLLLCALTLGLGLYVTVCQADNHARARALAECQRLCEMVEAGNAQAEARALAHLPGELGVSEAHAQHAALSAPMAVSD